MSLPPGTRLGPYEIQSALGEGGMGEVYRARDTRLDRSVAIKVLAPEIAGDPAARSRFEREARAVAALDHPHICGIFDVGEANGAHYLVMPHLDGQTLAARLEKGPLPLDQALTMATQVADALDKAHRQGIVHRDLKPANIMLTKTGAKLLDFGLAKLRAPGGPIALSGIERLATTSPGTAQGTILGTVQYMAPEQAEGREADARSDIWALGAVIYEMLTGMRPFLGDTPASVIGAILKDQPPPVSSRQPLAAPLLDRAIARCLEKDPDTRWQSAADVQRLLEWARDAEVATGRSPAARHVALGFRPWLPFALAGVLLAAVIALLPTWLAHRREALPPLLQLSLLPPPGTVFSSPPASVVAPQLAISPDGRQLAFVAQPPGGRPSLWVRALDSKEGQVLRGTEDAFYPFWSPDSRSLGFFAQGRLKVIEIGGGPPRTLTSAAPLDSRGGTWGADGTIVFAAERGALLRIPATGGTATPATRLDESRNETTHRFPAFLPDGLHFLYATRSRGSGEENLSVSIGSLDLQVGTPVISRTAWAAQFASPGYVLFMRAATLFAQPFDLDRRVTTGDPVALAEGVGATITGYSAFSVSRTGVLAYARPIAVPGQLRWFDRAGNPMTRVGEPAEYLDFELSPDEKTLAFSRVDDAGLTSADLWLLDLARNVPTRFTAHPMNDASPVWSPDGTRVVFRSNRQGYTALFGKGASGTDAERVILDTGFSLRPTDWSADGKLIVFSTTTPTGEYEVWVWRPDGTDEPRPAVRTPLNATHGRLSPNGRWLAYASDESGEQQVWLQSFPDGNNRHQVSPDGGSEPRWRRDGNELFYLSNSHKLMSVAIPGGDVLDAGTPRALFDVRVPLTGNPFRSNYAVTADGLRFLINTWVEPAPPPIDVVVNWPALLRK